MISANAFANLTQLRELFVFVCLCVRVCVCVSMYVNEVSVCAFVCLCACVHMCVYVRVLCGVVRLE